MDADGGESTAQLAGNKAALPPDVHCILSRLRRAGLLVLALGTGFGVMVVELAGGRVMAPAFGLSAVPWTAVIGVILAALAAGNWFGGYWGDRGSGRFWQVPARPPCCRR